MANEKVTYGFKVDAERKEDLQKKINESGMSPEEFILSAVTSYEKSRAKLSIASDIEIKQVDEHLTRVSEIFTALCKSRKDAMTSHVEDVSFYKGIVEQQKAQILDAKTEAEEIVQEVRATAKESVKTAEEHAGIANKALLDTRKELAIVLDQTAMQADLISEYKSKNDTLTGIIAKNQSVINQAEELQADYTTYKTTVTEQMQILRQTLTQAELEAQKVKEDMKHQAKKHQ